MAGELLIKPSAKDWLVAGAVYARFRMKPGSRHIATVVALAHLAALLRQHPVKSVLEFGSGIGTTYLLVKLLPDDARIVCAERDAWCREQFERNIPAKKRSRIDLIPEGRPEIAERFDLVVVDGPVTGGTRYVREGSLWFHEGNREVSRTTMQADMAAAGLACPLTRYATARIRRSKKKTRFGTPKLRIRYEKGCYIGRVQRLADARPEIEGAAVVSTSGA